MAVAVPTRDASGQPAGFVLNCASVHAFCNVVNRAGSCLGSVTRTFAMFASPPPVCGPPLEVTFTVKLAPLALLVLPAVDAANPGLNGRLAQFDPWNGLDTPVLVFWVLVIVPLTDSGEQLVGLKMNPERSMTTLIVLTCRGMPCRMCGSSLLTTVTCAVCGSTLIAALTTIGLPPSGPRLNGPASACSTMERPN